MTAAAEVLEPELQFHPIEALCDSVSYRVDGWRKLILMENLRFYAGGVEKKMDALLCLNHDNPSYPTKLYLAEKLDCGLNWNETAYILGRNWFTFSWGNVSPQLTPIEILAAHLAPLNGAR